MLGQSQVPIGVGEAVNIRPYWQQHWQKYKRLLQQNYWLIAASLVRISIDLLLVVLPNYHPDRILHWRHLKRISAYLQACSQSVHSAIGRHFPFLPPHHQHQVQLIPTHYRGFLSRTRLLDHRYLHFLVNYTRIIGKSHQILPYLLEIPFPRWRPCVREATRSGSSPPPRDTLQIHSLLLEGGQGAFNYHVVWK